MCARFLRKVNQNAVQFHSGFIVDIRNVVLIYLIKFVISTLRYTCAQLLCVILQRLKLKFITGGIKMNINE